MQFVALLNVLEQKVCEEADVRAETCCKHTTSMLHEALNISTSVSVLRHHSALHRWRRTSGSLVRILLIHAATLQPHGLRCIQPSTELCAHLSLGWCVFPNITELKESHKNDIMLLLNLRRA